MSSCVGAILLESAVLYVCVREGSTPAGCNNKEASPSGLASASLQYSSLDVNTEAIMLGMAIVRES